jgi:mono/diheme cytochrome c family protein
MYRKVQALLGVVLVALVTLTGHFGGNLTHGDTFLVEYAPGPLRRLAGLQDARAPVTDPALADPYLDVVRPIFNQRCFSCHNDDKQRGGLNLAKYEAVMKGGKDGKVIAPGEPEKSDMYRRITLAKDHNDFMPAEGKTPLTDNQVALIRWWIQSGAQTGTTVAQLKVPPQTATLIASQLGVGAAGASAEAGAAHGDPQQNADPAIITKLEQAGFMARQESLSDARLVVSQIAPQSKFTDEQVAVLAEIGKQIVQLNLQHAGLKDTSLKSLQPLSELTHLRLENNDVTDRGIAELAGLAKLQYLNLYGNKAVTDAAVDSIAKLTALKHVYLWNTGVTPKGAVKLKELRPDLHIDMGVDSDSAARAAKVSG